MRRSLLTRSGPLRGCLGTSLASFLSQLSNPKLSLNRHSAFNPFANSIQEWNQEWKGIDSLRQGYYWTTMESDCNEFVKRCHKCKIHANLMHMPPTELTSMTTPWPFSVWGSDIIGKVTPKASNGHEFILVAIDYFTKWVEAASYSTFPIRVGSIGASLWWISPDSLSLKDWNRRGILHQIFGGGEKKSDSKWSQTQCYGLTTREDARYASWHIAPTYIMENLSTTTFLPTGLFALLLS